MEELKRARKVGHIITRRYQPGEDLTGVSVSENDNPETDLGWIAINPDDANDRWYINSGFFDKNYEFF